MMAEHTKRIDVVFVYKTRAKLYLIFDIQFLFVSLSSKWPSLILQDGTEKCKVSTDFVFPQLGSA